MTIGCIEDRAVPKLSETLNDYGKEYHDWINYTKRIYGAVVNPYLNVTVTTEAELTYQKLLVLYNVTGGGYYLQSIFPYEKVCKWQGQNCIVVSLLLSSADKLLAIDNARIVVLGTDISSAELNSTYQTYLAGGAMYSDLATTYQSYTVNSLNEKYYRIYSYCVNVWDRGLIDTQWAESGLNYNGWVDGRTDARTKANNYALLAGFPVIDYNTIDGMAAIV